jgi:hypothetical protein
MLTHVEFRSDRFPPYEGEEEDVNPDLWGKRLAEFVREKLLTKGIRTEEPFSEDWGWQVNVVNDGFALWIGCGRYQEYPDWYLCLIEPHTPYIHRLFKKVDVRERVAALQAALDEILEADGIRDKRWWTYEEFTKPST